MELNKILILAESEKYKHNREVCGVCLTNGLTIALTNRAANPYDDFAINSGDITPYLGQIEYIWHTHCSNKHPDILTPSDIAIARKWQLPIAVFHIISHYSDYYDPKDANPFPINGRMFLPNFHETVRSPHFYTGWQSNDLLWGRTDCFEVVRCYYLGVLGIEIGNFDRPLVAGFPPLNWRSPWIAEDNGFAIADGIQNNDIIEIALNGGRYANHLAVVIDAQQGLILHQPGFGHLSKIGKLGGYWYDRIALCQRTNKKRMLRYVGS